MLMLFLTGCEKKNTSIINDSSAYNSLELDFSGKEASNEDVKENASSASDLSADTQDAKITVYVCGAVKNCGVYELDDGARINDLINLAGGFLDDADSDYLNLAAPLKDGYRIEVPTNEMTKSFETFEDELITADAEKKSGYVTSADDAQKNSDTVESNGLVNINTADETTLCTLSGIGEQRAKAIIDYREQNGNFKTIDELCNVSGIKGKTFEKIKNNITV